MYSRAGYDCSHTVYDKEVTKLKVFLLGMSVHKKQSKYASYDWFYALSLGEKDTSILLMPMLP